jgi:hypothetical protein
MKNIVLVACCGAKLDRPAPAGDLYQSQLFLKAKQYAETNGDAWYILSAEHGLLAPDQLVAPYDKTLNDMSIIARLNWSANVAHQLVWRGLDRCQLTVLAGEKYCGFIDYLPVHTIATTTRPLWRMGIGQQLQWLTRQNSRAA